MRTKKLTALFALLVFSLPLMAIFDGRNLSKTLHNLCTDLRQDYQQISVAQANLQEEYTQQHQKMVDIIKECNELSLILYSQKQDYTFDLSFALQKVTSEFEEFSRERTPYDRIANNLTLEIDRYARLLEALRRLPPEREELDIDLVPDSLLYRNDTLNQHLLLTGAALDLQLEAEKLMEEDSVEAAERPFLLDSLGEQDRDSCIFFSTELLKMYADSREIVVADSIHYREAYLRLKESYDYAITRYKLLQHRIFQEGQTPWLKILGNWSQFSSRIKTELMDKYISNLTRNDLEDVVALTESGSWDYLLQLVMLVLELTVFMILWFLVRLVLRLIIRFVKPVQKLFKKEQVHAFGLLLTVLCFFIFFGFSDEGGIARVSFQLTQHFLWLLVAITAALLFRLRPEELKNGFALYRPTIYLAAVVMGFRVVFAPNSLMNLVFPPILAIFFIWLLINCLRMQHKIGGIDRTFGWVSLTVTGVATVVAFAGYIFVALLLLVWWYFQLSSILTVITVWHLVNSYREKRLGARIQSYRESLSYVPEGPDKETLMFGMSWFYELVRGVVVPLLILLSIPLCLKMALEIFDFTDLFKQIYLSPFINLSTAVTEGFRVSFNGVVLVVGMFFVFRYLKSLIHYLWKKSRYAAFMRKNNRTVVRQNEMNLALGTSIISVLVWFVYILFVVRTLRIPTGSLALVAGGLSAGIGLALKDILNNFIYGIQLMSGRLKVGDWIECDGIRGSVVSINYQTTEMKTEFGTMVSFLNATLFSKNFTNLTKGNSYEFLKIVVGLSYGTNVQKLREVLEPALQELRTRDQYGREVVDPAHGIYIRFNDFGDSAIEVAVKQYVLVAERIAYVDRARELIYNTLNRNGFTIPFPQCDVHLIKDDA